MATKKDYYDILGISKSASDADIKAAYKKLAKEHHPDMVNDTDKKAAEERFKEINEAYQTLKDPQKRKMYDQFGHAGAQSGPSGFGGFGGQAGGQWGPFSYSYSSSGGQQGFDPFDIFEEMFGFRGFGGQRRPRKGKNLYYEMQIDFVDAVTGIEKEIAIESGKVKIKIPAGVRNGTEMKFGSKGMPAPEKGLPNGDLFITFRVPTPQEFIQRVGDDLVTVITIDIAQATLGDTIKVPVVDPDNKKGLGQANLKIPAGTQPGTQFRIKDKGMPRLRGRGRGAVIVQTIVKIPKKLNKKQKKLLEDLQKTF